MTFCLLQRTTRRIGLTDAGLAFFPYCVGILSDAGCHRDPQDEK
jgi:DNA-binding transcriptional LysR family regulator